MQCGIWLRNHPLEEMMIQILTHVNSELPVYQMPAARGSAPEACMGCDGADIKVGEGAVGGS